ncbi:Putative glycosyltransferase EpsD [Paenibacillus konkukensis]|uniref:Glycosyltransferase EpsD n=1 Tax=Paenibacillus konkukensis TaxID=2020716 RepID=A0ABY4RWB1_9BACL|nr:glycosyltransferase family 4 protein [Paenibacillus konkukensis]UQZ86670.1 Putative glycosyltransferase EpsD [Paenibacillus konkukensis]
MRILLATYWRLPHVGGVNAYVRTLQKKLEENGHHVDVLAHHPDMKSIYLLRSGQSVDKQTIKASIFNILFYYYETYLPHVDSYIRWKEIERYTFELAVSLLGVGRYDVIHAQDIVSARALSRIKPDHIPLISTVHGIVAEEYLNAGVIASKESLMWKYAAAEEYYGHGSSDRTIVPTRWQVRETGEQFGCPSCWFTVIPYGIDLPSFYARMNKEAGTRAEPRDKSFVIACPARLVPEKDHRTLIDALSILKERRSDFGCWLIGDGTLREDLEQYCKEKQVSGQVLFMGNRSDVPDLLNQADAMVLPSLHDMHPYSIMEAQAAGKAVIASDAGGIPEMVEHGVTGLLFRKRNAAELADRIAEVWNQPELRERLQTNAKVWGTARWSADRMLAETMEVYRQAAAAAGNSGKRQTMEEWEASHRYGLRAAPSADADPAAEIFHFSIPSWLQPGDTDLWERLSGSLPPATPFRTGRSSCG